MNLADITTKCYILALIIRDDGERLLLGDGAYEFKDSQQHFIANTYANDVVELQGTDGQMLAGQVRRTATQTFAGYIGDATFSKQAVESARRDFLMFFRKKHYYTAVYVFSDGTAIQRDRGYIVNAPSVPELYQRYPEWSVGLNFEDPNYYEYAEDDLGQEIAAHKVELELSTAMSGGLIWDGDGAVSDDLSYVGTEIPGEGKNFQLADTGTATLKSAELLGDAEQDGTPTPDAPVAVNTVTGEQVVKIEGKNLFLTNRTLGVPSDTTYANTAKRLFNYDEYVKGLSNTNYYSTANIDCSVSDGVLTVTPSSSGYGAAFAVKVQSQTDYVLSYNATNSAQSVVGVAFYKADGTYISTTILNNNNPTFTTPSECDHAAIVFRPNANQTCSYSNIMLVEGSTAEPFEPYQGQELKVNLGKNLADPNNANIINAYIRQAGITAEASNRLVYYKVEQNSYYTISATRVPASGKESVADNMQVALCSDVPANGVATYDIQQSANLYDTTLHASFTVYTGSHTYLAFKYANATNTNASATLATIQLERGSQATTYAPYFTPVELAKIGNYQDRIYKDEGKWYVEKQVGKVAINITGYNSNYANVDYAIFDKPADSLNYGTYAELPALCDSALSPELSGGYNQTAQIGRLCSKANTTHLWVGVTKGTTQATSKTMLDGKAVYYALATPTTTEITNSELVGQLERLRHSHTYADTTNFSITATSPNLPAFLKVVAFGDDAIPQGGYVWEDGGTGGATTITVDGVDNAQPIWTVVGPATNPSLTNITTGESIQWTGVVPNGQTLVVNMADMTASLSGANVFEFISGSWITLQAGNNRVSYSATAATGIATLEWNGVVG